MQNFNWIEIAKEAQRKKLKPGNINYIRHEMLSEKTERIGTAVLNAACKVYKNLGPELLEKVYEVWT